MQDHRDRQVIVNSSDKMWSIGETNSNQLKHFCLEIPMDNMKRQKDMMPEDKPPKSKGIQCSTGEEQRTSNSSSSKNEEAWPKQVQCSVVNVFSGESKALCYKEQYCIGAWM